MYAKCGATVLFLLALSGCVSGPDGGFGADRADQAAVTNSGEIGPTTQNASSLLPGPQEFPTGWHAATIQTTEEDIAGLNSSATRGYDRDMGYNQWDIIDIDVKVFNSTSHAESYYQSRVADIQERTSTEQRTVGGEAIYWEETREIRAVLAVGANVVVLVDQIVDQPSHGMETDKPARMVFSKL